MNLVALLQAQAEEHAVDLGLPTYAFGIIALVIFAILLMVLWSFRDVANRHSAAGSSAGEHGHASDEQHSSTSNDD